MEQPRAQRPLVDQRRVVAERLLDRPDDLELLVLDLDPLQRRGRGSLVLRRDRGNGLAGEAHAVDRDDRPVADRVTPVGVDVGEVRCREDADDAGHALRLRVSTETIRAWAIGERSTFPWSMCGTTMSPANCAWPRSFSPASRRGTDCPTTPGDRQPRRAAHAATPASSQTASTIPR